MKKPLLLFSLFFSVFIFSISAENILTLTNPKTQETNVFRKGSYLVFELKADKSVREGFILDITDSSLMFDDSQVSLSQINIFAGSTKGNIVAGRVANAVGSALIIAGTSVFDCGLGIFVNGDGSYYYWPIGGSIWLAGTVIAGIGYAFDWASAPFDHVVRVRNYREWNPSIIMEEQDTSVAVYPEKPNREMYKPKTKKKKKKKNITEDDVYGQ